jgi:hypothetical protein
MIDAWPSLAKQEPLSQALSATGHDGRACDQFGTLLACAWLLLNDDVPDESEVAEWARCVRRSAWPKCPTASAMKRPASTG